ncbi:hypothetical protein GCM10023191_044900 [Actinoallomurus oryzae]|uniref:Uncharacterized protein n=1 Tax=Actinoallomurus oryzae TaxID=502180 RepID=A0ABP8Q7W9_9ACTN
MALGASRVLAFVDPGDVSELQTSQHWLRYDRDIELLLIAEASRRLTTRSGDQEAMESVMALLERQQHVAACRALDRPIEA